MRLPTQIRSRRIGFNMTPMIDVVFLLIIFFLVSSHLARQEVHLELPLPSASSGQAPQETEAPRVTLNVQQDGAILWGGRPVKIDKLSARLASFGAASHAELKVRIRSDRNAPYRLVEPILLACARANVWDISFAVLPRE